MDTRSFRGPEAAGVHQRAKVVFAGERDAVAMSLQLCQIDEVVRLRDTGGQIVGIARNLLGPYHWNRTIRLSVIGASQIHVAELDTRQFAFPYCWLYPWDWC